MLCIRRSHESLDSGEIDPEEECIEIIETTSMKEEYGMLQSDLCFYQTPEKYGIKTKKINNTGYNKRNENTKHQDVQHTICVSIDIENNDEHIGSTDTIVGSKATGENSAAIQKDMAKSSTKITEPLISPATSANETKQETIKNEVIFKSIFGATKNAIFRTAQSIIDNHEKKFSSKNKIDGGAVSPSSETNTVTVGEQLKSPTEIAKKKEFFTLKPCLIKSKTLSVPSPITSVATTPSTETTPESELKCLAKISVFNGHGKENKIKVPGGVRCLTKSKSIELPLKSEKGHSGLLRFFESPIFNIHFALHYLFYSKEPGVLSFIGNKIFNFKDSDVDLYIPQLILMYIQMDELAEVLDPYLVYRCRRNADFSLKCCWLLEAYNYNVDSFNSSNTSNGKGHLSLFKELYPKRERRQLQRTTTVELPFKNDNVFSPVKKTHHRYVCSETGMVFATQLL